MVIYLFALRQGFCAEVYYLYDPAGETECRKGFHRIVALQPRL